MELISIKKNLEEIENLCRKAKFTKFLKDVDYKKYSVLFEKYNLLENEKVKNLTTFTKLLINHFLLL